MSSEWIHFHFLDTGSLSGHQCQSIIFSGVKRIRAHRGPKAPCEVLRANLGSDFEDTASLHQLDEKVFCGSAIKVSRTVAY
jgi:hypothetical protein